MKFDGRNFIYLDGDKLFSKSLDNNWWLADTAAGAFMNTTKQYAGLYIQRELVKEITKKRSVSVHCRNRVRVVFGGIRKERRCYETIKETWEEPVFIPGITF